MIWLEGRLLKRGPFVFQTYARGLVTETASMTASLRKGFLIWAKREKTEVYGRVQNREKETKWSWSGLSTIEARECKRPWGGQIMQIRRRTSSWREGFLLGTENRFTISRGRLAFI